MYIDMGLSIVQWSGIVVGVYIAIATDALLDC